jgi:hypothetical protein
MEVKEAQTHRSVRIGCKLTLTPRENTQVTAGVALRVPEHAFPPVTVALCLSHAFPGPEEGCRRCEPESI